MMMVPIEEITLQIVIWAVIGVLGWAVGRITSSTRHAKTEDDAMRNGMRSLLRGEIMRTHHSAMRDGYVTTVDREVMERNYIAYHDLGGNGVATKLYDEFMGLPTKED